MSVRHRFVRAVFQIRFAFARAGLLGRGRVVERYRIPLLSNHNAVARLGRGAVKGFNRLQTHIQLTCGRILGIGRVVGKGGIVYIDTGIAFRHAAGNNIIHQSSRTSATSTSRSRRPRSISRTEQDFIRILVTNTGRPRGYTRGERTDFALQSYIVFEFRRNRGAVHIVRVFHHRYRIARVRVGRTCKGGLRADRRICQCGKRSSYTRFVHIYTRQVGSVTRRPGRGIYHKIAVIATLGVVGGDDDIFIIDVDLYIHRLGQHIGNRRLGSTIAIYIRSGYIHHAVHIHREHSRGFVGYRREHSIFAFHYKHISTGGYHTALVVAPVPRQRIHLLGNLRNACFGR